RTAATRRASADGDAPRQLADRDLRNFRVGVGVDHGDRVGSAAGDVEFLAVRCERHVPWALADGDLGHGRIGGRVAHLPRSLAARGDEYGLAIGVDDHAIRTFARLDARNDVVRLRVEDVDRVRIFGCHVRATAVGKEADAARAISYGNGLDHFALGNVD